MCVACVYGAGKGEWDELQHVWTQERNCWGIYRYPPIHEKWEWGINKCTNIFQVNLHVDNKRQKVRSKVCRSCFFLPDFKDKSNVHVDGKLYTTGSLSLCDQGAGILTWNPWANVMNSCTREAVNALHVCTHTHLYWDSHEKLKLSKWP